MIKTKFRSLFAPARRKWSLAAVLGVVLATLVGLTVVYLPLEIADFSNRLDLWRGGVTAFSPDSHDNRLHGYIRNSCPGTERTGEACSCVALIHGSGDSSMTWKSVLLWPEAKWKEMGMIRPLYLFAVDLPGAGLSLAPAEISELRVRKQAEKLRQTLASLCSQWVLVGNDLGGWVASWLALDWGSGVQRLLLLNSSGLHGQKSEVDLFDFSGEGIRKQQKGLYFRFTEKSDRVWAELGARAQMANTRKILEAQVPEDELNLHLGTLRIPTMMLWGKEDQVYPLRVGYELRALLPSVIWREVDACGHLPQQECPLSVIQSIIDMANYGSK